MIEVLVALVVLTIGMLGLAALCVASLRASRAALYRTQAVTRVADLAERLRANRLPADAYDCGGTCAPGAGGNALAIADLTSWLGMVEDGLPGGTGAITFVGESVGAPARYTVTVRWAEVGSGEPAAVEQIIDL